MNAMTRHISFRTVSVGELRSEQGRHTHRITQTLRIGDHELELLINKGTVGVVAGESASNSDWKWPIIGGLVLLVLVGILRSMPRDH
jgi:hypothetical protein